MEFFNIQNYIIEDNLVVVILVLILFLINVFFEEVVSFFNVFVDSVLFDIQNYIYDLEIVFGFFQIFESLDEILFVKVCVKNFVIRRGSVFLDIMNFFLKEEMNLRIDILELSILIEKGEDFGGVFWDVMFEYWEIFYLKYMEGVDVKIFMIVYIMK